MPLSPGQMLTQRYRIVRLLGQGGFGAVYRAWDVSLAGPCAIKESLDTTGDEGRQFEREARMLFKLRHPRLPLVFDYFVIPDQGRYLVMDYIDGEDLDTLLEKRSGPLPVEQALDWILQTCEPLAYLHEQTPPVIHRDLKPANIRLASDGQIYLVDFGIAKMYHPSQATATGARAVTSGYSPPEQYTSGTTDARSDVYALGATLYHLLTGRRPPDSLDVRLGVEPPPPPAHRMNPAVSPELSGVIQRAMQLEKQDRWAGIAEFKQELERAVRPPQDPGFVVAPSMPVVVHPSVIETPAPPGSAQLSAALPEDAAPSEKAPVVFPPIPETPAPQSTSPPGSAESPASPLETTPPEPSPMPQLASASGPVVSEPGARPASSEPHPPLHPASRLAWSEPHGEPAAAVAAPRRSRGTPRWVQLGAIAGGLIILAVLAYLGSPNRAVRTTVPSPTPIPASFITEMPAVEEPVPVVEETVAVAAAGGEEVTLTIESFDFYDFNVWQDTIIPAFEAAHPGIKVVFAQTSFSDYNDVLKTKLAGGTAGDLIQSFSLDDSLDLFNRGHLADLTGLAGLEHIGDVAKSACSTDDGSAVFCLPVSSGITGFIYNKTAFDALGLAEPTTVDEFHSVLEALKTGGTYTPIAMGTSDEWVTTHRGFQNIGPVYWKGEQGRLGLIAGTEKFTDPQYVEVFQELVASASYLPEVYEAVSFADSQSLFTSGQAAIYPAGSWEISGLESQVAGEFEMGVFPPPVKRTGDPCYITSQPDIVISMNAKTAHPEEARAFLEWMTSEEFASLYGNALPGLIALSNHAISLENPLANEFFIWRQNCEQTLQLWSRTLSSGEPDLRTELWRVSAAVINGRLTPEQAAQEIQAGLDQWYVPAAGPTPAHTATAVDTVLELQLILDEAFEGSLSDHWRVWGSPAPTIDQGLGQTWLSLKAADPAQAGVTFNSDAVYKLPGTEIGFTAQLDPNLTGESALVFDWDPALVAPRGPQSEAGVVRVILTAQSVILIAPLSEELAAVEMDAKQVHHYTLRFVDDFGVELSIDGAVAARLERTGLDSNVAGTISFSGYGFISQVRIFTPGQ